VKSRLGIKQEQEQEDYNQLGDEIDNKASIRDFQDSDVPVRAFIHITLNKPSTSMNCLTRFRKIGMTSPKKMKVIHAPLRLYPIH